jgi:hypothetical protein
MGQSAAAFQDYSVVLSHMVSSIPSSMSYEKAFVIPRGLSTSRIGLFQKNYLGPAIPVHGPEGDRQDAAGYEVITTASPKNLDYVKKLGASQAFDYKSLTSRDDLIAALKGERSS